MGVDLDELLSMIMTVGFYLILSVWVRVWRISLLHALHFTLSISRSSFHPEKTFLVRFAHLYVSFMHHISTLSYSYILLSPSHVSSPALKTHPRLCSLANISEYNVTFSLYPNPLTYIVQQPQHARTHTYRLVVSVPHFAH